MLIGVAAAAAFATGERWGLIAGAVLLQLAFTADCVDGQLARYTKTFTKLGAWLDSIFDRTKEYLVFAGLAIGSSSAGDPVWLLAGAALTLQTVRHMMDFSAGVIRREAVAVVPEQPLENPRDRVIARRVRARVERAKAAAQGHGAGGVLDNWRRLDDLPGVIWVKRIVAFPIGERFAVISLTAAVFDARTTFAVLLAWGTFAAFYLTAGRLLRSIR
jgi:hypothetical protein